MASTTSPPRDLGDFQTPPRLAEACLKAIGFNGARFPRVLEPTCGTGTFLVAGATSADPPREMIGIEVQASHVRQARLRLNQEATPSTAWDVIEGDVFRDELARLPWKTDGTLLVVGNPPWVTVSELGAMKSSRTPDRRNIRSVRGIAALTGESNFDVAEYIWMRMLTELVGARPHIAMLCKTSVARRVLTLCNDLRLPLTNASLWRIDAKREFGAAVDACFFHVEIGEVESEYVCDVYESLDADHPTSTMGIVHGELVADIDAHRESVQFDGSCQLDWRQGVKHDLANIMELVRTEEGKLLNGREEIVEVEDEVVFPLMKGSDVNAGRKSSKSVIVTQRSLGEDTQHLRHRAPSAWSYLRRNAVAFEKRGSSVYRHRPAFAMFGIGPYTFAPWKVAISGLHKTPRFILVPPVDNRPVLFDDTVYFLPFESPIEAAIVYSLLSGKKCSTLLQSLVFIDSKRPITKKLLTRIDLAELLESEGSGVVDSAVSALATAGADASMDEVRQVTDDLARAWQPDAGQLRLLDVS